MIQQAPLCPVSVVRRARPVAFARLAAVRTPAVVLIGATLAFAVLLTSCGSYVDQRVEAVIVDALPRAVGPANHYSATVRGASADLSHFGQVHAVGVGVRRPHAPVFERIELDLLDVTVDRNARQITAIGAATVTATLGANDLAAYLGQQPWITEPAVRVEMPATIIVSGRLKLPGIEVGILPALAGEFRGTLAARGSQLRVSIESLRLGKNEAPALARGLIEQAVNPLFDIAHHAVPSRIDRATVEGQAIVVTASGSQLSPLKRNRGP